MKLFQVKILEFIIVMLLLRNTREYELKEVHLKRNRCINVGKTYLLNIVFV